MNDDRVFALDVENPDLEQRTVARWAKEHSHVVPDQLAKGVPYRMNHVLVSDSMLAGGLTDSHYKTSYLV